MIGRLTEQLKRDEGQVKEAGRHVAYQDHLGFWTIGYGRLIDRLRNGGISDDEADYLLANDIRTVKDSLQIRLLWFGRLNEARQAAMINMAFQLGVNGLMGFKRSLAHMVAEDYEKAADEFLNSKWATQTPERALRVTQQIRTGIWQ